METLLIIILIVGTLALLSNTFRTPPALRIIYVQTIPEPTSDGFGCLPWIIGILILLVVLGVIRF